jgi:hypothetical protein
MTEQQIEQLAAKDNPMPDGLTPPEQLLFQNLRMIYKEYKSGMPKNICQETKKKVLQSHKAYMDANDNFAMWTVVSWAMNEYHDEKSFENADKLFDAVCKFAY